MNEDLQKQLIRQLKIINFWITFFGVTFLLIFAVLGFFLFKVVTVIRSTEQKITNFQQQTTDTLNVKDDLCKNNLLSGSSYCK